MSTIKEQNTFLGYVNNSDPVSENSLNLSEGSKNVFITGSNPNNYSVEKRNGYILYGQEATKNDVTIRSSYDRFANNYRIVLPVREYLDSTNSTNIEFLYKNNWYLLPPHTFPSTQPEFSPSELHEPYFSEWWDDKAKRQYLTWVYGIGGVFYWSGGVGDVVSSSTGVLTIGFNAERTGFFPSGGSATIYTVGTLQQTGTITYTEYLFVYYIGLLVYNLGLYNHRGYCY